MYLSLNLASCLFFKVQSSADVDQVILKVSEKKNLTKITALKKKKNPTKNKKKYRKEFFSLC